MNNQQHTGTNALVAFLAGATAGATAALLLAPQSGHETREQLAGAARKGRERISGFTRHRRDQGSQVPSALAEASEAAKEAFVRSMSEIENRPS